MEKVVKLVHAILKESLKTIACSFKGKIKTRQGELREERLLLNTRNKFLKTILVEYGVASIAKRQ